VKHVQVSSKAAVLRLSRWHSLGAAAFHSLLFFSCVLLPLLLMALFNFTTFFLTASVSFPLPDSTQHHSSTCKYS